MTFAADLRLDFIDFRLATRGEVRRGTIAKAFGVSDSQASADIADFVSAHPSAIAYDLKAKAYRPKKSPYRPQRPWTANPRFLAALTLLREIGHPLGWSIK